VLQPATGFLVSKIEGALIARLALLVLYCMLFYLVDLGGSQL